MTALTLAALIVFLVALGNTLLRDWDEATFAQVSREMLQSRQWLHPTYFGAPYPNKPPLLFWIMSVSFGLGGISDTTARLPGALLAALGVPLLYLAGRHLFDRERPALMAALVYVTLLPVVRHGRLAMIDGMVNTFLIAADNAYLLVDETRAGSVTGHQVLGRAGGFALVGPRDER